MKDNILELGSVIKLKESGIELMVIGYYPVNEEDNETYDYLCVNQFIGMIDEESLLAVNEDAIDSVVFHGYKDEAAEEVMALAAQYEK